jgi:hypothetical protein
MTGDFTSVPLRATDRWTAARMQQGRVLLDTDWNLVIDGAARDVQQLVRDAIGPAGVPTGSTAFQVGYAGGALTVQGGSMWVGGLLARNPADLAYADQAEIDPLPATGLVVVYLDVWSEEVQAAEDGTLLDPALDDVDTTTRTRVGWRVRTAPAAGATCGAATLPPSVSTGRLDVARTTAPVSPDPCAPPDDPRSKLPDGLLRIEVIDAGTEATARFAWSYADGGDAVAATVAGTSVTLAPSPSVTFAAGDLAEVSTLARRADRRDHGPLFSVSAVTPSAGGDEVTLATASALTGNPPGTCLRRWDGESVGAATQVPLTLAGADVGIAFTARSGDYLVGDWWGVRVRGSAADAVETLTDAPPEGVVHACAPLAVVDLGQQVVHTDCRPQFPPLTEIRGGTCTVTAFPGDDLQAALDALPVTGGELCLAAGTYPLGDPLMLTGKSRVTITGVGPSTVLAAGKHVAVLVATDCPDVEVTRVRVEGARPGDPPGDAGLLGALTFLGCSGVTVHDCQISCPDSTGRSQSCVYVAPDTQGVLPGRVEIRGNRLETGSLQTGVLVISADTSTIADNTVLLGTAAGGPEIVTHLVAHQLGRYVARYLRPAAAATGTTGTTVNLPDSTAVRVDGSNDIRRLAREFASNTSVRRLSAATSVRSALARFATASITDPHQAAVGPTTAAWLAAAIRGTRSIGQGIVVAGTRATLVRIEGNQVGPALQGIHVGLQAHGPAHTSAGQVVVSDNTVVCGVPFFWVRERHAFFVGNVSNLTMTDNHARLVRTGTGADRPTDVDAVRVYGDLGPWLHVRGLDLTGPFNTGVLVRNTGPGLGNRRPLRYVGDVLNADGTRAVDVAGLATTERCVP